MKIIKRLTDELTIYEPFEDPTKDEFENLVKERIECICPTLTIEDIETVEILAVKKGYDDMGNPALTIKIEIVYQIHLK